MSDEFKELIVEGEKVGDYNDTTYAYDKYGKGAVQKIDYGHGTIRPNLWGLKTTPPKKGKKRK